MTKLFMNLPEYVEEKDRVSPTNVPGKWFSIDYRTKLGEGKLLAASYLDQPKPVTVQLNLTGWYRIYISLFEMGEEDNYVFFRLSDDEYYTPARISRRGKPEHWHRYEYMEEVFWKCADLTGQKLHLAKPHYPDHIVSGIAWIRCEEMTPDETDRYKASEKPGNLCVQTHFDPDSLFQDRSFEKEELWADFAMHKGTNTDFCSLEYYVLFDSIAAGDYQPLGTRDQTLYAGAYTVEEIFRKYLILAHQYQIRMFAAMRMSMSNFYYPWGRPEERFHFMTDHPEYYCRNRDGSVFNVCSYVYPEVGTYVIGNMVKMIEMGYDGITMIFHRGVCVGFEKPVLDLFHEKYPDVNPCELPIADERLHRVWCDVMTAFMRRARKTLDEKCGKHVDINVITDYGTATARSIGIDVETWAREGLIDCVSQGDMEIYEDLTDCMKDDNPSLIDLEKMKKRLEDYPVLKRNYATDVDKVCLHIPEYTKLEEEYGVKAYHVLPWVHSVQPEDYQKVVERMRSCGARRFLAWNTNSMVWNLPEYHIVSSIGNDPGVDTYVRKFYRVQSFDRADINLVHPNWRG